MEYYDLGAYSSVVSTTVADAQLWYDRGLNWTYGFNHEEAVVCFRRALEHDPSLAMAHWGIAYASGPNYNMSWDLFDPKMRAKALSTAYSATQSALALLDGVTTVERTLITALTTRYPQSDLAEIEDMTKWEHEFCDVMRMALADHPDQLDLRAVFAESLLNLTPWKMWDLPSGAPADGAFTIEAQQVLEHAMNNLPGAMKHPAILHLYIHLMEMSPFPQKALRAADVLRTLVPDAGHLVHMPTHIDVLCGHYHNVVYWNQKAVEADLKYYRREGAYNFYTGYRQHNYHFIIYGALFLGQYEPAMEAVRGLHDTTPEDMLRIQSPPMADYFESYMAMAPHVLIRFGRWDEAIALQPPVDTKLFAVLTASIHYARAVAFAATGRVAEAEAEEQVYIKARDLVPDTRINHNNKMVDLFEIATEMLRGEIEYRKGNFDAAFAHLRRSVEIDDNLPYDEPWGWMQPTRHALGALLFEQGHVAEAEVVYREDLGLGGQLSRPMVHPDNVWSLKGLHDCLKARGETEELRHISQRLELALSRADVSVAASCFCAQAAMTT